MNRFHPAPHKMALSHTAMLAAAGIKAGNRG